MIVVPTASDATITDGNSVKILELLKHRAWSDHRQTTVNTTSVSFSFFHAVRSRFALTTTFQTASVQIDAGISSSGADSPADAQQVTPEVVHVMQVVSCLCVFPCVLHIQKQKEMENKQNESIS